MATSLADPRRSTRRARQIRTAAAVLLALLLALLTAAAADAVPRFSDGPPASPIQNTECTSISMGTPWLEPEVTYWVGQYIDDADGSLSPVPGEVFDLHVVIGTIGNSCGGTSANIELALPPGVTPAVSPTVPIRCWWTNNFSSGSWNALPQNQGCPAQALTGGTQHPVVKSWWSLAPNPATYSGNYFWMLPKGMALEIQFPVVADRPLKGVFDSSGCACAIAAVQTGNGSAGPEPSFKWSSAWPTGTAYQHLFVWSSPDDKSAKKPPTQPKQPDNPFAPAKPKITAPKSVRVGRAVKIGTTCSAGCKITPTLKIGKKKVKGVKTLKVKPGAKSVNFKLSKKVVKQIRRALKKNRRTKVTLTLTPSSSAGKGARRSVRIR